MTQKKTLTTKIGSRTITYSIRKSDGRLCHTVSVKNFATNTSTRKYIYGKNLTELRKNATSFYNEYDRYGSVINTKYTLATWMHEYLFVNKLHDLELSTFTRYEGIYRKYILNNNIGNVPLENLTLNDFQRFFNSIVQQDNGKTLSRATLTKIKNLLHSTLDYALKNDLIRRNPIDGIKIPKSATAPQDRQILTTDEQERYIAALLDSSYRTILLTAISSGMRLGELIALTWDCVDFNKRIISVKKSVSTGKQFYSDGTYSKQVVIKGPKSKKGYRDVLISSDLCLLLNRLYQIDKEALFKEGKISNLNQQLVFKTKNQTMYNKRNVQRAHYAICKKAGIKTINLHSLRHTYASNLLDHNFNMLVIRDLLGHSKITTTEIYTHATNEAQQIAHEKIDHLYSFSIA